MVGAAWGVTARKPSHQRSPLTRVERALPLVGTAWGVTARKANHNASNARGVTAGKMVCVSVKYRRPNRWTDQYQIWHAYADGPGDGSYLNKFDPPPNGGRSGNFRGSKIQSPGNVTQGVGGGGGQN